MKLTRKQKLFVVAFVLSSIFLLTAFAAWEINPGKWTPDRRSFCAVVMFGALVIGAVAIDN